MPYLNLHGGNVPMLVARNPPGTNSQTSIAPQNAEMVGQFATTKVASIIHGMENRELAA